MRIRPAEPLRRDGERRRVDLRRPRPRRRLAIVYFLVK